MTSVRVRLTLWYFAVLTVSLIIFGFAIYLLVRQSVNAAIDADLQDRLAGVDRFMKFQMARSGFTLEDVQAEFREHSGIRQGGDLVQVADLQGNWIFQSTSIRNYAIRLPKYRPERPTFDTLQIQSSPVRVLSSSIRIGDMT